MWKVSRSLCDIEHWAYIGEKRKEEREGGRVGGREGGREGGRVYYACIHETLSHRCHQQPTLTQNQTGQDWLECHSPGQDCILSYLHGMDYPLSTNEARH